MRVRSIESVEGGGPDSQGPVVLHMTFSQWSGRIRGAVLCCAGVALAAPFGFLCATQGGIGELSALAHVNTLASVQLVIVALLAVAAVFGGAAQLFGEGVETRMIRLDGESVEVEEVVRGRRQMWRAPVRSFRGIRHRVMTTSSGAVHTLMLEHINPARSLHLAATGLISDAMIQDVARRYGLPVLGKPVRHSDHWPARVALSMGRIRGVARPRSHASSG